MKKTMLGALLITATMVAQASTLDNVESSTVVQGTIVLAKDGSVQTAVVDDAAKYGQSIADLVRKTALQWRFKPVLRNDEPVMAKANMHVRVVLKKMPSGEYSARIKGATFGDGNSNDTDTLHKDGEHKWIQPQYPMDAIRARVQGTVYLSLHVDRSGRVTDAVAEQVNLGNTGSERIVKQYREILAKAAITAARKWTYAIPTTGKLATRDSWTAHVPVSFNLKVMGEPDRVWQSYIPGPYTPSPWVDKPDMSAADAFADDAVQTEGAGPTLLSPINHS
jgi:TonB family protein